MCLLIYYNDMLDSTFFDLDILRSTLSRQLTATAALAKLPAPATPALRTELSLYRGCLLRLLAQTYLDTEELSAGDTHARRALPHLAAAPLSAAVQLCDLWNQLAALSARHGASGMRRARAVLQRALVLGAALGVERAPRQAAAERRGAAVAAARNKRKQTPMQQSNNGKTGDIAAAGDSESTPETATVQADAGAEAEVKPEPEVSADSKAEAKTVSEPQDSAAEVKPPTLSRRLALALARALPLFTLTPVSYPLSLAADSKTNSKAETVNTSSSSSETTETAAENESEDTECKWEKQGRAMAISQDLTNFLFAHAPSLFSATSSDSDATKAPTDGASAASAPVAFAWSPMDAVLLGCARADAQADTHAITLFSLAQVYTLWGAPARGASYCRQTLALQLTLGTLTAELESQSSSSSASNGKCASETALVGDIDTSGMSEEEAEAMRLRVIAAREQGAPQWAAEAAAASGATAGIAVTLNSSDPGGINADATSNAESKSTSDAAVVLSPTFDAFEWARNAMRLSSFFTARDLFANADECLRGAKTVATAAVAAARAAARARGGDAAAAAVELSDGELQTLADIDRARAVLMLAYMRSSAERAAAAVAAFAPHSSDGGDDDDEDDEEERERAKAICDRDPYAESMLELLSELPPLPLEAGEIAEEDVIPLDDEWLASSTVTTASTAGTGAAADAGSSASASVPDPFEAIWRSASALDRFESARLALAAQGEAVNSADEAGGWFPELQPSIGRARVFAPLATVGAARAAFREGLAAAESAAKYYVLDGFVTDHIEITQETSALWKALARWEDDDAATLAKIAKRRIELLEPIVKVLNSKAYRNQYLDLTMELGLTHLTMADAKATQLAVVAKELELPPKNNPDGSAGRHDAAKVSAHVQATVKMNALLLKSAQWFGVWFNTVASGLPHFDPRLFPSNNCVPALAVRASWPVPVLKGDDNAPYRVAYITNALHGARAFSRIVAHDAETQLKALTQSASFYALVGDFAAANKGEIESECPREIEVAREMLSLMQRRIAMVRAKGMDAVKRK